MSLSAWTFQENTTGFPIGPMTYREMDAESGYAEFSETDGWARRVFLVDWDQSTQFMNDLLGSATKFAGGSGVTRVIPDLHPEFRMYALSAKRITDNPSSVVNGVSQWARAKIDATYRAVDYYITDDDVTATNELYRFVHRKVVPKGDYLQLATNSFRWFSRNFLGQGNPNLGAVPGIIAPEALLEYTWHAVPAQPPNLPDLNAPLRPPTLNTILTSFGCTNSTTFDTVFAQGTVLFTGAEATLIPPRYNDLFTWKIRYFFQMKDNTPISPSVVAQLGILNAGVNFLYDPINSWWDIPLVPANPLPNPPANTVPMTSQALYNYVDLNALFTIT